MSQNNEKQFDFVPPTDTIVRHCLTATQTQRLDFLTRLYQPNLYRHNKLGSKSSATVVMDEILAFVMRYDNEFEEFLTEANEIT